MLDVGYVEWVEDHAGAYVSTAAARADVDAVLAEGPAPDELVAPAVDREAWLRGDADGQSNMLTLAAGARR